MLVDSALKLLTQICKKIIFRYIGTLSRKDFINFLILVVSGKKLLVKLGTPKIYESLLRAFS